MEETLTPEQARAARSLLHWSQSELATRAGVAVSTVADFERGQRNPIPNNVIALRKALMSVGLVFTEGGGVSHGFQWTFMTQHGMSSIHVKYEPKHVAGVLDFASIFGTVTPQSISIDAVQSATSELKAKLSKYIDQYGGAAPHLHRLKKTIGDLAEGEFFLLLPKAPSGTAEIYECERFVHQLNHPEARSLEAEHQQLFGELMKHYNLSIPRTDRRFEIGNPRKKDRTCRFCHRTVDDGATFEKEAHAIPAALGNQYLKLADECDTCNGYFGEKVEPTLVELLNIQRVFLGIKARGSLPKIEIPGGHMFHDGERMVIRSSQISKDAAGALTAQLGKEKNFVPVNFYKALAKIALSVIPESELPALNRTREWVRFDEARGEPLPKIATAVVLLPPDPSAQIALYIRKDDSPLPHVVCEFRLGCYMYVFVLPFSKRDCSNLLNFFDDEVFKATFRHYSHVPSWTHQDCSGYEAISIAQRIKVIPNELAIPKGGSAEHR